MFLFVDLSDHDDQRRRVDGAFGVLVVEADVAAGHGSVEGHAAFLQALHAGLELPEDLRLRGIAEIQAVRQSQRASAGADDVPRAFRHGDPGTHDGVEVAVAAVAVRG